jgi:TPR repeat protein
VKKTCTLITVEKIETYIQLVKDAENDNSEAQYEVGNYFYDGLEVDGEIVFQQNKAEAFKWIKKAYENGNDDAMIRMANFYSEGEICERNLDLAIELYKKGIERGIGYSAINLATIYRDRNEYDKAFELYQTAQKLDKTNLIELAYCYHYGIGTKKNKNLAFEIFQKIANDDSENRNCEDEIESANYYLGNYYLEGEIVEKSIKTAREYFNKANRDNKHRNANDLLLIIGRK